MGDTLYEVQQAGNPMGLFTVGTAFHLRTSWYADGKWKDFNAADKKAAEDRKKTAEIEAASAEFHMPGGDDEKPRMKRRKHADDKDKASTGSDKPKIDKGSSPSDDDPDRPKLHRGSSESEKKTVAEAVPATNPGASPDPSADDPNRPRLRRNLGKETSGGDLPSPEKIYSGPAQMYAAVSDAQSQETRPLNFNWTPEEQQEITGHMKVIAETELRKALGAKKVGSKIDFRNVDVRAYDIDYSNNPTVVMNADFPAPLPAPKGVSPNEIHYLVTLVARQDTDGKLTKLYFHVSNPADLDASPELRLVDAVDADGDGRAELLFRKTAATGTGWLLERVTPYTVTTVFDGVPR